MFDRKHERTDLIHLLELMEEVVGSPACSNFPEAFFPEPGQQASGDIRMAKQMCSDCPIKAECLKFALKHTQIGIWGGLTATERRRLKKLNNSK
jgi:hypothetical protein